MINPNRDTVPSIHSAIQSVYAESGKIHIIRSPYILSWCVERKGRIIVTYQLILSPAEHPSQIFAGYHSDIVCVGYSVKAKTFHYAKGRWDNFMNRISLKQNARVYFFGDMVPPSFAPRVDAAASKYRGRGFNTKYVRAKHKLNLLDAERSDPLIKFDEGDITWALKQLSRKYGIYKISNRLEDVYHNETMRPLIETMNCFHSCSRCGQRIFSKTFCDKCKAHEESLFDIAKTTFATSYNILVTGGRCGLGKAIRDITGAETMYTTRYPGEDSYASYLDLKDPDSWSSTQKLIESGKVNLLVLSAAETLHYDAPVKDKSQVDWTGDFIRPNTGVWHKTLEHHTYPELVDPLLINVAGCAALLGSFIKGAEHRDLSKPYMAVVVTSYEGRFDDKSSYHPMTNASKAAIEQVVWTLKRQTDLLGVHIVLADPGWMYTESSKGKVKGPVPLEYGATQILSPFVACTQGQHVPNASLWRRNVVKEKEEDTQDEMTLMDIQLFPCGHIEKVNMVNPPPFCSTCKEHVTKRSIVQRFGCGHLLPNITFDWKFCPTCGETTAIHKKSDTNVKVKHHDNIYCLESLHPKPQKRKRDQVEEVDSDR